MEPYVDSKGDFRFGWRYLTDSSRRRTAQILHNVHKPEDCAGRPCVIHNPSDHHMRKWPLHWRDDRMIFERLCPHGIGHPDPDSLYHERLAADGDEQYVGVHGCDGCCASA